MVIAGLRQVFRLSEAQDNMRLVHEAEKAATQASLIHLAGGPRTALHAEYATKKKSISWLGEFRWELGKTVKQPARNRVECMKFNPPIRWGTNAAQCS